MSTTTVPGSIARSDELRSRILFTLGTLLVWRMMHYLPLPGIDLEVVEDALRHATVAVPERISVMAIGLTPFLTAWAFAELGRGSYGDAAIARFRRVATVALAIFQAMAMTSALEGVKGAVSEPGLAFRLGAVSSLVAGTMVALWLGELITRRGLGDGVWLLLAVQFIAPLPRWLLLAVDKVQTGELAGAPFLVTLAALIGLKALIVLVESAERRVPVTPESADHGAHRLALPVDNVTILPAMLVVLVLIVPMLLAVAAIRTIGPVDWLSTLAQTLAASRTLQLVLTAVLIVPLTYVATAMVVRPRAILDRLEREGGAIGGRGARDAERHIDGIVERLTAITALYLLAVSMVPELAPEVLGFTWPVSGVQLLVVTLVGLRVIGQGRAILGS